RMEFRRAGASPGAAPDVPPAPSVLEEPAVAAPEARSPETRQPAAARGPVDASSGVAAATVLIAKAVEAQATDLFLSNVADARMRVGDVLLELEGTIAAEETLIELAALDEHQRARLDQHGSVDVAFDVGGARVRVNLFRHRRGLAAAVRPI